jgi:hypothetical protein
MLWIDALWWCFLFVMFLMITICVADFIYHAKEDDHQEHDSKQQQQQQQQYKEHPHKSTTYQPTTNRQPNNTHYTRRYGSDESEDYSD